MKRTKLKERTLPAYTFAEEIANMVTHIVGGVMGLAVLMLCALKALGRGDPLTVTGALIYGLSIVALYTVSSIYHGLRPGTAKKVMQVVDHCTIYFLIAGTYTPVMLTSFVPAYPAIGWGLLAGEWLLLAIACTLTAIDLKKYRVFSNICYITMGWGIIFFVDKAITRIGDQGFALLLSGGIAYTIGAILFAIGVKKHWFHALFHIFVVIGSLLQFLAIYLFVL